MIYNRGICARCEIHVESFSSSLPSTTYSEKNTPALAHALQAVQWCNVLEEETLRPFSVRVVSQGCPLFN
jgi:hypothetical protein